MPEKSLRVLVAIGEVSELLLVRRLLRDTPYTVDAVRGPNAALRALCAQEYAAVVVDDERLPEMPGAKLLAEAKNVQPRALRVLLARKERVPALQPGAKQNGYRILARPFFAPHLRIALLDHAQSLAPPPPRPSDAQPAETRVAPALKREVAIDADTSPHEISNEVPAMRRRLLRTMVELVEAKSGATPGHGMRVCALASALAKEAGLRGGDLIAVEEGALIHDVGELAVPGGLLASKRRLTPAEQAHVRRHSTASAQVAMRSGLSRMAILAVRHHHERFDGKGYPEGLSGQDIPLAARIVAVADTWDALATGRPYRPALKVDDCTRTFKLLGGTQLDRELVELFLRHKLGSLIDWSAPPAIADLLSA
jgi:response regulator RpfG family c-di-GMP phosphodiesterase